MRVCSGCLQPVLQLLATFVYKLQTCELKRRVDIPGLDATLRAASRHMSSIAIAWFRGAS